MTGSVVVQIGHWPRKVGATGTSGHRGTEQQFAFELAHRIKPRVETIGHRCTLIGADDPVPYSDVFIALHQDGSTNPAARGASVGYPDNRSAPYATAWKANYARAGWPGGFRADNYTHALRSYYAFRRTSAPVRVLMEHGFATNVADCDWMWDNLDRIADVHAVTVGAHFGTKPPPPPAVSEEDDEMILARVRWVNGSATDEHWHLVIGGTWHQILNPAALDYYANQAKWPQREMQHTTYQEFVRQGTIKVGAPVG